MFSRLKRSLAAKILAFQVVGLLAVLLIATAYQYRTTQDNVYQEARRVGESVAQMIESLIVQNPEVIGSGELWGLLQVFGKNLPASVAQVRVVDAGGIIVADLDHAMIGRRAEDGDILRIINEGGEGHAFVEGGGAHRVRITHAIEGRFNAARRSNVLGAVSVEIDLTFADQRIRRSLYRAIGLLALLLTGFWAANFVALRTGVVSAVREIRGVAERFGDGHLGARAMSPGDDELGDLGRAFNAMAERIERATEATRAEVRSRQQAQEELSVAHSKLAEGMAQVEERNREIALLSEMSNVLHACVSASEAFTVVASFGPRLFPGTRGALYVLAPSRDLLRLAAQWAGDLPADDAFSPLDCWALRRGHPYIVEDGSVVACPHVLAHSASGRGYVCVPLLAQNETLGLIYLQLPEGRSTFGPGNRQLLTQLAIAVGEQASLALANLSLRETLREQSVRDPLTGLYNRRYLEESLNRELVRARRRSVPVSVLAIDVDHFKRFNDVYGHDTGDRVLRGLGNILQTQFRGSDVPCRHGGEEFVILLPEASADQVAAHAEQLRVRVSEMNLTQPTGEPLGRITVSMGIAEFPKHAGSGEDLLKAADTALYRAKTAGRDRVELF